MENVLCQFDRCTTRTDEEVGRGAFPGGGSEVPIRERRDRVSRFGSERTLGATLDRLPVCEGDSDEVRTRLFNTFHVHKTTSVVPSVETLSASLSGDEISRVRQITSRE